MTSTGTPGSRRESSCSGGRTNCVGIAGTDTGAAVRDSKDRAAGYFTTTAAQWTAFVGAVKDGRFER